MDVLTFYFPCLYGLCSRSKQLKVKDDAMCCLQLSRRQPSDWTSFRTRYCVDEKRSEVGGGGDGVGWGGGIGGKPAGCLAHFTFGSDFCIFLQKAALITRGRGEGVQVQDIIISLRVIFGEWTSGRKGYLNIRNQVPGTETDVDLPKPTQSQSLFAFFRNPSTYGMIRERGSTARVQRSKLLALASRRGG